MKIATIKLMDGEDVDRVCNIANMYHSDIDAVYQRYIVDAKSFLGLLGIMGCPIDIHMHSESQQQLSALRCALKPWATGIAR